MGREIRRVPVDFDWPLNQRWSGFLRPDRFDEDTCPQCAGRGMTPARAWVSACAYAITMLEDDLGYQRRGQPMHPYFAEFPALAEGTRPSSDIAELVGGLCGNEAGFLGRGTSDAYRAARTIVTAAGLDDDTWGWCTACSGEGSTQRYPGQRAEAEEWRRTDPPTGDGWQLWETLSEGSPISPVFSSADGLAEWLSSPAYTWGISTQMTREAAQRFVEVGWAPSMVSTAVAGLQAGEQWVGENS